VSLPGAQRERLVLRLSVEQRIRWRLRDAIDSGGARIAEEQHAIDSGIEALTALQHDDATIQSG
jgi:hypothetical protein